MKGEQVLQLSADATREAIEEYLNTRMTEHVTVVRVESVEEPRSGGRTYGDAPPSSKLSVTFSSERKETA